MSSGGDRLDDAPALSPRLHPAGRYGSRPAVRECLSAPETVPLSSRSPGRGFAATRRVMGQHLGRRPVHVAESAMAETVCLFSLLAHGRGLEMDFEGEADAAEGAVVG